MIRWLTNGDVDFHEQPVTMFSNGELRATPTGNVEDEPGSRKLHRILQDELRVKEKKGTIAELHEKLRSLGIPTDSSIPNIKVLDEKSDTEGKKQHIQFESEPGIWIDATLYLPASAGRKPAVLMVSVHEDIDGMPPATIAEEIIKLGHIVLEIEPRTSRTENNKGNYTGDWISDTQANLIGRNLPAMRAHDILRGVDLLCARENVDPQSIRGTARGVAGIWLLLAAAADSRLKGIWLDKTPYSLRSALDRSMTADLLDAVIPNFILSWDLVDLVKAIGTHQVFWTDPTDWMHGVVALGTPYRYRYVLGDITDEANEQEETLIRKFLK